jgi:uncharacterized protein YyaL (SSP411 family)
VNRLASETSPYLRQHRDNPVDWYPWGPEAFAAAAERDRPILLSVGYSACHWCHVMAHESFEDEQVAAVMNELFVNIKVDREERPDVDSIYMDAVQAMTGRGGWPMTVFLTPDGHPFFGGTYFPKPGFLQLMASIDDVWRNRRADLDQNVDALREALDRTSRIEPADDLPGVELLNLGLQQLGQSFDPRWGGFGAAPKFPSTMGLELVLRAYVHTQADAAREMVTTSLDAMASGGMYDHLGGGFARYSVDERWLVPHFEKMLYDQALLGRVYLHAWQLFGEHRWRQVVEETIGYVLRDLRHDEGGFFSAEDADSLDDSGHSHEGHFYVWTPAQIEEVLGAELTPVAIDWYEVTPEGNFEGATILSRLDHRGELDRPADVERARALLFAARAHRPRPGLDDKVLTEWNALMLGTLAQAAAALGRDDWMAAAIANGEFLLRELRDEKGEWRRAWQADAEPDDDGLRARHHALAADHAALVEAFLALAEGSGEARWIAAAGETADAMLDQFWDAERGGLYTTGERGEQLIVRQKDVMDNATPSANSMAANGLYRLAALTGEPRYEQQADQILRLLGGPAAGAPSAFAHLLAAVDLRRTGAAEVVVAGDRPDLVHAVQVRYLPNAVLAWGERYDSPLWEQRQDGLAYVCRQYACLAPQDSLDGLVEQLAQVT